MHRHMRLISVLSVASSLGGRGAHAEELVNDCRPTGQFVAQCENVGVQLPLWRALLASELVTLQRNDKSLITFDVSSEQTRRQQGMIPGARALSSATQYDVALELPQERGHSVVFYCSDAGCTGAQQAAERAVAAGYRNVYVLPSGVAGWKKQAAHRAGS